MALGAAPRRVKLMVLRRVGILTVIGGLIGLTASFWIGKTAEEILYQMKGRDPVVFVASAVALAAVAMEAGLAPAHGVSKVGPMTALRYESPCSQAGSRTVADSARGAPNGSDVGTRRSPASTHHRDAGQ